MMNKSKKYIAIAFVVVLIVVVIVSTVGILSLKNKPEILQGQAEATEIRISGTPRTHRQVPGRRGTGRPQRGYPGGNQQSGNRGEDDQVDAIKNAAVYENQKIEEGTRKQIVESAYQLWMKKEIRPRTRRRPPTTAFRPSTGTAWSLPSGKTETEAIYKAALAGERAAFQQYQMALDGARKQDRESSQSMVDAARSTVKEVAAVRTPG